VSQVKFDGVAIYFFMQLIAVIIYREKLFEQVALMKGLIFEDLCQPFFKS